MPKFYVFPILSSINIEFNPERLPAFIIFRKKSPNMLAMKSGEKPNPENYSVFLETLIINLCVIT